MFKPDIAPTLHETRSAERLNLFLMCVFAIALIIMAIGLVVADGWRELLGWMCVGVWAVLVICLLACVVGLHGGRRRG